VLGGSSGGRILLRRGQRRDIEMAKHYLALFSPPSSVEDLYKYSTGSSAGYCLATLGTVMALGPFLAPDLKFCPPATCPVIGIGALSRYLNAHSDRLNDEKLSVMIQAFEEVWPCK
jgi:hypothetical protein